MAASQWQYYIPADVESAQLFSVFHMYFLPKL